jgi:cardiolipin synthase
MKKKKPKKAKKYFLRLLLATLSAAIFFLGQTINSAALPSSDTPILFYSTQTQQDLQGTFVSAIESARQSIHLTIYSLSDEGVIQALKRQAEKGIRVSVICDAKASPAAKKKLGPLIHTVKRSPTGLMHQKILVVDGKQTWIGSANMTRDSLRMHSNLVMAFDCSELATVAVKNFLEMPEQGSFPHQPPSAFMIGGQRVELYLLPDPRALDYLLSLLRQAKKSLHVAMFTWTHPRLTEAVIDAHRRGVTVNVMLDANSTRGASAETLFLLRKAGVNTSISAGTALLHHKLACIDGETLICGSANWTRAAFTQNDDCFVVIHQMNQEQNRMIENLWKNQPLLHEGN